MSRRLWLVLGLCALALAPACSGVHTRPRTVETVGGALRSRPFASATAYEAFLRAEVALTAGEDDVALAQLELALLADSADGWLAARRAEVLLRVGRRDEASEAAQSAARRFARDAAPWLVVAEVALARGDTAGATAALSRALTVSGDDAEVRAEIARLQGPEGAALTARVRANGRAAGAPLALERLSTERPLARAQRRERAERALRRGLYREVEVLLGALVAADARAVQERLVLLDARLADGRTPDARALVPGLPLAPVAGGLTRGERARLWLRVGRPAFAEEDARAALRVQPDEVEARAVLAVARLEQGAVGEGLGLLGTVPASAAPYVEAWQGAVRVLFRRGESALGARLAEGALARLGASTGADRDRLRVALGAAWLEVGSPAQAQGALAQVESAWGRQRRAMLLAWVASPAEVLRDLRERTGDASDDAWADAWRALLCYAQRTQCDAREAEGALAAARQGAAGSPETVRAAALAAGDRRARVELERHEPWRVVGLQGSLFRRLRARAQ